MAICNNSVVVTNRRGDKGSPCLTPLLHLIFFPGTPFKRIEDVPDEQSQDTHEMLGNLYSSFSEEEQEIKTHHEEAQDMDVSVNEGEISDYCK